MLCMKPQILLILIAPLAVQSATLEAMDEIRPGNPKTGAPFWNVNAASFMYPPAFDFKDLPRKNAERPPWRTVKFHFTLHCSDGQTRTFDAADPWVSLKPIWAEVPVGPVVVTCEGVNANGSSTGYSGVRAFWRTAPFNANAPRKTPKRSYAKANEMAIDYIFTAPELTSLVSGNGAPRKDLPLAGYPSKTYAAGIQAMVGAAKSVPARREEALHIARLSAEWLLKNSQKTGTPLEYWPETYASDKDQECWSPNYRDRIMLLYPAMVGRAYLALAEETGEMRWLEAARRIGETYVKVRRADGTWPIVLRIADGKALFSNSVVPNGLMLFFEGLYRATKDVRWRTLGDECFVWLEKGPIADWNWEGQFEDTHPRAEKYGNLTHHAALDVMQYVLKRYPGDPARLKLARELMRFAEDQFVHWERPCLPDGRCLQFYGARFYRGEPPRWSVPSATEQYDCYVAIDSSTAKLASSFYAIGRATGNRSDLSKARALCDQIVDMQCDDGSIPTFWNEKNARVGWLNCHIYSANVLRELAGLDSEQLAL